MSWFKFKNIGKKAGELCIYGDIVDDAWYEDDVTLTDFKASLDGLGDINELTVRINSSGGSVWAGNGIYNLLKAHKANITTVIDGIAASIAGVIFLAGDVRKAPKNALFMSHKPMGGCFGNSDDFKHTITILDKVQGCIESAFEGVLTDGKPKDYVNKETWLSCNEAFDCGIVTEIVTDTVIENSIVENKYFTNGLPIEARRFANFPKEKFTNKKVDKMEVAKANNFIEAKLQNMNNVLRLTKEN